MSVMDTKILNVDDKAHSYAKVYASLINDELQRKRAYASIVALYSLIAELEKTNFDVQKSMTLFRNPVINGQYEIADVYVNNWHIDVRVVTEGNGFLVPKSHFDVDIVPDFYAVVRVDNSLKTAELLGFVDTAFLNKEPFDYHYYGISFDSLISYEDFVSKIKNVKLTDFPEQEHEFFRANYLSLMDGEIDIQTKNRLLKHLFECAQCRTEFCCFTGFEMVSCNIGKYPNILEDQTLNIIGAQAVDSEKYAGKEETINISNDIDEILDEGSSEQKEENSENESDETKEEIIEELQEGEPIELKEETVSDILDELFNVGDDVLSDDIIEEKEIDTTPQKTVSESGDLEIFEENAPSKLSDEVIDFSMIDNNIEDLEVIVDNSSEMLSDDSDEVVLIESEPIEFNDEELEIKPSEEIEIIEEDEDVEPITEENVQKVIVDYDEFGEPIYSYITNVSPDEVAHIEPLDEDIDILNEEFETYVDEDSTKEDLSEINNGSARPIEYVQPTEENAIEDVLEQDEESLLLDDEEVLNIEDEVDLEEKQEVEDEILDDILSDDNDAEETLEDKEEVLEDFEEYKDEETSASIKDDDILDLEDDVITSESVEEENLETEKFEEYDEDSEAEDIEEYGDEEETEYSDDEEYEEEEDEDDSEIPEENIAKSSSKKNILIVSALLALVLAGGGIGTALFMKNNAQNSVSQEPVSTENNVESVTESQVNDMFEAVEGGIDIPTGETTENNVETIEGELIPPPPPIQEAEQEQPSSGTLPVPPSVAEPKTPSAADVSNSIANAFSPTKNTVTLRSVNWLCAPQLFADATFKSYLQNLDNILKLNLRKNILDVSESPTNNTVTVKMAVNNNGNLVKVAMGDSSGSEQVDNIVLQSINETFEGEKSPILNDSAQKADMYYLKVVIKL